MRKAVPDERPYLVTGASGFVGRHLLAALAEVEPRRRVLVLVRDPAAWRAMDWTSAHGNTEPVRGSVLEADEWFQGLPPLAGIFHLAAIVQHTRRDPEAMIETNVQGGLQMVRLAAAHRCRMIAVSTSGTVGCFAKAGQRADERAPSAEAMVGGWPYYRSKIEFERRARALADERGVDLCFVRPPVLLGPGDHRLRSTRNVWKAVRRRLPFVVRGGINFADVRDTASLLVSAMSRSSVRPVYHVEGTECSIDRFFRMVEEVSGVPRPPLVLPYWPAWLLATAIQRLQLVPDPVVVEMASRYWGVRSLYAEEELGYKPRDPRETLRDTVDWLREHAERTPD